MLADEAGKYVVPGTGRASAKKRPRTVSVTTERLRCLNVWTAGPRVSANEAQLPKEGRSERSAPLAPSESSGSPLRRMDANRVPRVSWPFCAGLPLIGVSHCWSSPFTGCLAPASRRSFAASDEGSTALGATLARGMVTAAWNSAR